MKLAKYLLESKYVYDNSKGDTAYVEEKSEVFYVEVNNKYDMEFDDYKELNKWLKKEKFAFVGVE